MPQDLPGRLERDDQSRRLDRGHSHLRREDLPALPGRDRRSYDDGDTVNQALEEGWKQGVAHSMADGIVTQTEEPRFREFRDRLALSDVLERTFTAGYYRKIRLTETHQGSRQ